MVSNSVLVLASVFVVIDLSQALKLLLGPNSKF